MKPIQIVGSLLYDAAKLSAVMYMSKNINEIVEKTINSFSSKKDIIDESEANEIIENQTMEKSSLKEDFSISESINNSFEKSKEALNKVKDSVTIPVIKNPLKKEKKKSSAMTEQFGKWLGVLDD